MADDPAPEPDVLRAIELADGYVAEAEDALWTAASETDGELAESIEQVTRDVWGVQQRLEELRERLED
jgi:hypothetical protein